MANEIARTPALDALALMISSPALRRLRRISIGTVQWPGQPIRTYLAGGLKLTDQERREATSALERIKAATTADDQPETRKQRHAIVSRMLLTYPMTGASAESGKARGEAYLEALDDLPPWVIAAAVRRWNRGGAGEDHDYRWAPAPATLRKIAIAELAEVKPIMLHLESLLAAVLPEEAIKRPTSEDRAYVVEGFQKLKADIGAGHRPQHQPAEAAE